MYAMSNVTQGFQAVLKLIALNGIFWFSGDFKNLDNNSRTGSGPR